MAHTILTTVELDNTGIIIPAGVFMVFDFSTHKISDQKIIPFDLTTYLNYDSYAAKKSPIVVWKNGVQLSFFKKKLDNDYDVLMFSGKNFSSIVSEYLTDTIGEFNYVDELFEKLTIKNGVSGNSTILTIDAGYVVKVMNVTNATNNDVTISIVDSNDTVFVDQVTVIGGGSVDITIPPTAINTTLGVVSTNWNNASLVFSSKTTVA